MEVNEYVFGIMWLFILFETMILIGVFINSKQRESRVDLDTLPILFGGIFLGTIGILIIVSTPWKDPLFAVGLGFIAICISNLIFVIQEKSSKKVLKEIVDLKEYLKYQNKR
jgi:Kef-type K+ transport system membrane component KefB